MSGRSATWVAPARIAAVGVAALGVAATTAAQAGAQDVRGVGLTVGRVASEQRWSPPQETSTRMGWQAGAFVDVSLPVPVLGVLVEGLLVQRGSVLVVDQGAAPVRTEIESDYLSMPILLKVGVLVGPVGASLVVGPTFEMLLRTRVDDSLAPVFGFERGAVWSLVAGLGVEALVAGRGVLGAEVRVVEGLGAAYAAPSADVRYRSLEVVGRLGLRPGQEPPPP